VTPLVKPFRALRFDVPTAGLLDDLIAPPYDVISTAALERLAGLSDYNVIRLIRPHEPELAARRLREWIAAGVLVREDRPALWRIEESYVGPDGVARARRGLVGRLRLEPFEHGVVLRHERTFRKAMETRLQLLRATRTKLSPLLVLHDGSRAPAGQGAPDVEATLEGTTTRLWRIDDPAAIEAGVETISEPLVIADGHHRYEAALRFHQEDGTEETAYVMAVLVSLADPGLTIFPTHRVVRGSLPALNGDLRLSPVAGVEEGLQRLAELARDHPAFVVLEREHAVLAEAAPAADPLERLDVSAVDRLPLEGVSFTPFLPEVERALGTGEAEGAFLVRAPTVADVQAIARSGRTMPQKSTYFYPKLASGLLLSPFDE
jgi:uncharacterized protein (DUF1015 family)